MKTKGARQWFFRSFYFYLCCVAGNFNIDCQIWQCKLEINLSIKNLSVGNMIVVVMIWHILGFTSYDCKLACARY